MDAKVSTKTKTKTVPVQNLFRYISFYSRVWTILKIFTSEFYFIFTSIKTLRSFFRKNLNLFSKINKHTPTLFPDLSTRLLFNYNYNILPA